jgi:acyl CoA:acetate/3-ketoacid CoA transferase
MPQGGSLFGCAIQPVKLMSSAEMFELWEEKLQVACLGAIEFDPSGAVNVSRKGPRPAMDFIGSGGFPNIASSARTVIFITRWVTGAGAVTLDPLTGRLTMHHDKVKAAKLVPKVREVTYSYTALNMARSNDATPGTPGTPAFATSGTVTTNDSPMQQQQPQRSGGRQFVPQEVYFVTEVAVFRKRPFALNGLDILSVAPGIDVHKDIVAFAAVHCPEVDFGSSPQDCAAIKSTFVTGEGFTLSL